jgi:hypothetical protein
MKADPLLEMKKKEDEMEEIKMEEDPLLEMNMKEDEMEEIKIEENMDDSYLGHQQKK